MIHAEDPFFHIHGQHPFRHAGEDSPQLVSLFRDLGEGFLQFSWAMVFRVSERSPISLTLDTGNGC